MIFRVTVLFWFPPIFLSGNTLPVAILSLWDMLLQTPNQIFPDGVQNIQYLNFQTWSPSVNASKLHSHWMHCLWSNTHAQLYKIHLNFRSSQVYLWNKLCIKERLNSWLQIKFWKGNNKQQKQLPVYLSLWDFSGAQKLRKQISSALLLWCYLKESASLLCFCPPSDSDSCWVASRVQMKYQIISWGLQFSFLLIF